MAQVDTSIYGRQAQPDFAAPLQTLIMGQQIGQNAQRNRLTEMALQKEQGLNEAYAGAIGADGTLNRQNLLTGLATRNLGSAIPGVQKGLADQDKSMSDAQLSQYKAAGEKLNLAVGLMSGITDQNSLDLAHRQAGAYGIPTEGLPTVYDPAVIGQLKQQGLSAKDQLDSWAKKQGLAVQQGQLAVSQDRLAFDKANPQVQFIDTPTGVQTGNTRTGQIAPAVGSDGKPVMGEKAAAAGIRARDQSKEAIQAETALGGLNDSISRLETAASEIMKDPALWRVTGVPGQFPSLAGHDAANLEAKLQNLKSQVGFTVLQAMRDASKTGGALGAISDKENELLQNNLAALNPRQSPEQFKQELQKIVDYANTIRGRASQAYQRTYGGQQGQGAGPTPGAGARPSLNDIFGG